MTQIALTQVDWHGHGLQLLPQRALWDPQQRLLLLADLHLGKAESFQASGVPLPSDGADPWGPNPGPGLGGA